MKPDPSTAPLSVSALNARIAAIMETTFPYPVWVEGELSNFKAYPSGHWYFTLKDRESQIKAVMFRGFNQKLKYEPASGEKVIASGNVRVYKTRGEYQLYATFMQPSGVGALQLAFEQLKKKLQEEGLFAEDRKRPLPPYPRVIGVVTSAAGAALRDILSVLRRRYAPLEVIVRPALVQGDLAAGEIAAGIADLNRHGRADVLIVGRGGGSLEDLWAFNEEVVARAIAASRIPVISAVGHEVDYTIADFVADRRAATPSAAAELVVQERQALQTRVNDLARRQQQAWDGLRGNWRTRLSDLQRRLKVASPLRRWQENAQRVDDLARRLHRQRPDLRLFAHREAVATCVRRLHRTGAAALDRPRRCLGELRRRLASVNPDAVLARGYSIVRNAADGEIVRQSRAVSVSDKLKITLARGDIAATVDAVN